MCVCVCIPLAASRLVCACLVDLHRLASLNHQVAQYEYQVQRKQTSAVLAACLSCKAPTLAGPIVAPTCLVRPKSSRGEPNCQMIGDDIHDRCMRSPVVHFLLYAIQRGGHHFQRQSTLVFVSVFVSVFVMANNRTTTTHHDSLRRPHTSESWREKTHFARRPGCPALTGGHRANRAQRTSWANLRHKSLSAPAD